MLSRLINPFRRATRSKGRANAHARNILTADDLDTPRYPPFMKGLPAHPTHRLLETQKELMGRLRAAVGQPDAQFDAIYLPLIQRYAEYVHLLPASQAHHHRGAGGLLRHGMEVALWAIQGSERIMFARGEPPEVRREIEPVWQCAVFVAGLAHDIGKPLSDLKVTDASGENIWAGQGETLMAWLRRTKTQRYFLHWRQRRHMRHESLTPLVLPQVIPPATMAYLNRAGPELYEQLLFSISARDFQVQDQEHNPIFTLVRDADKHSTAKDISDPVTAGLPGALGVPLERYIMDAIRRLVQNQWTCNKPGSRLWVIQDSVFIVWPAGARDIVELLGKDSAPGIPQQPDTLAEVLIDRGLAVAFEEAGARARLWPIQPDVVTQKKPGFHLNALRIDEGANLLSEIPASVEGVIGLEVVERREAEEQDDPADSLDGSDGSNGSGEAENEAEAETETTPPDVQVPDVVDDVLVSPIESAADAEHGPEPASAPVKKAPAQSPSSARKNSSPKKTKGGKGKKKTTGKGGSDNKARQPQPPPKKDDQAKRTKQGKAARKWFGEHGHAGAIISALAEDFAEGKRQWRRDAVQTRHKRVAIRHPEGWDGFGVPSRNIIPMMVETGWVEVDSFQPMKRVRDTEGFTRVNGSSTQPAVVLAEQPSQHFLAIAESGSGHGTNTPAKQKMAKPNRSDKANAPGQVGHKKSAAATGSVATPASQSATPALSECDNLAGTIHALLADETVKLAYKEGPNGLWLDAAATEAALAKHTSLSRYQAKKQVMSLKASDDGKQVRIPKKRPQKKKSK